MELSISFGIEELPADPGDRCYYCKEIITGLKFIPFAVCGDVKDVHYFDQLMCRGCNGEKWGNKKSNNETNNS
jgi:hypothetical protein